MFDRNDSIEKLFPRDENITKLKKNNLIKKYFLESLENELSY
jgi:hypothetical protein